MSSTQLFPQYPGGQSQNKNIYNGLIPIGGIILWSGFPFTIPTNWNICDGTNGTPNLSDKFVVSIGTTYSIGQTGGLAEVTLLPSEIPAHTHESTYQIPHEVKQGSDMGTNQHDFWRASLINGTSTTSLNTPSGGSHENIPPYFALAYIMRIS